MLLGLQLLRGEALSCFVGGANSGDRADLDDARPTLVLGERPSWLEGLGIAITLVSFFGLSVVGAREGIHFHRNKWVGFLIGGTLLGAVSGLYDKYLFGTLGFTASTVQCWFSIYLALLFLPLALGWKLRWWQRQEFHWRWSVVLVSLMLLVADFVYFNALRDPDALVSLVSSLRPRQHTCRVCRRTVPFRRGQRPAETPGGDRRGDRDRAYDPRLMCGDLKLRPRRLRVAAAAVSRPRRKRNP